MSRTLLNPFFQNLSNMTTNLSHLVFATPAEVFVAIQDDKGRAPISEVLVGSHSIQWRRADGALESINTEGSEYEAAVLGAAQSEDGLLMAVYQDISLANDGAEVPSFFTLSAITGPSEFCKPAAG